MKRILLVLIVFQVMMVSCFKDEHTLKKDDNIEICIGTVCGWCVGGDSLIITLNRTYYEYKPMCSNPKFSKETTTLENTWKTLNDKLDIHAFQSIEVNSCDVCLDGCDTWIRISNGSNSHKIRYGIGDTAVIKTIKPFIAYLDSIRFTYWNSNKQ